MTPLEINNLANRNNSAYDDPAIAGERARLHAKLLAMEKEKLGGVATG